MLSHVKSLECKWILVRTLSEHHTVDIGEDGVTIPLNDINDIQNMKMVWKTNDVWKKCPMELTHFDFDAWFDNMLALKTYQLRRTEDCAILLIHRIQKHYEDKG
eukprot:Awhi_evm1s13425